MFAIKAFSKENAYSQDKGKVIFLFFLKNHLKIIKKGSNNKRNISNEKLKP